jgi:hypothetical protein
VARATFTQNNFNGGEFSPLAYGRSDLAKYKNALATCLNYIPTSQGGLTRRPGTRYVAGVKNSANAVRIVTFEFSITQAYVLEFGPSYVRFYANDGQLQTGGVAYEVATPYLAAELQALAFTQSADVLYIAHPAHPPMKLVRAGALSWTLNAINFLDGPYLTVNSTATTMVASGTTGTVTVTASGTAGINGGAGFTAYDVGRFLRLKCSGLWLWGTISAFTSSTVVSWTIATATGSLVPATATAQGNASGGSILNATLLSAGGGYSAPPTVTIGGPGSGAIAYANVSTGGVTSVNMSATGTGYGSGPVAFTLSAPAAITSVATSFWRLGVWGTANGYPSCCTFNQDRLLWAACTGYPNRVDGSNTSDYENMAPTQVDGLVVDSSALSFTLNSNNVNAINWLLSDEWGLLAGTATAEWVIAASNQQTAVTPTNIATKQTSKYGTSSVPPVKMGKATLFVQRAKRKIREMSYQFTLGTFQAPDISLVGEHLTKSGVKQMAAVFAPQPVLWIVRNDGVLVGMSYDRDQEICGWHQHQLGGYSDAAQTLPPVVESLAVIPSPDTSRDEVWLVVQRYVNGAVTRYVEVMTKFWEDGDAIADAVFVDASAVYNSTPTTTVSGLTWLAGQTVSVLADGAVHPPVVVSVAGVATLMRSASKVQIGLGYTSAGKTLRIEAGGADGQAQGKLKRIHRAIMRLFQTVGMTITPNSGTATSEPFRTSADRMDNPVALFTGDKRWAYEGSYELEGQVAWSQTDPLPSNVLMVAAQLETQDGG